MTTVTLVNVLIGYTAPNAQIVEGHVCHFECAQETAVAGERPLTCRRLCPIQVGVAVPNGVLVSHVVVEDVLDDETRTGRSQLDAQHINKHGNTWWLGAT
jgi:hypothetical protein